MSFRPSRLALAALCAVATSHVESSLAAEVSVPRIVELQLEGPEELRLPLEASLREVTDRVGLSLQLSRNAAKGPTFLAAVTVDVGTRDRIRIVIQDAQRGTVIVERDIPTVHGATVAREDAVLVVRSTLDALLERAPLLAKAEPTRETVREPEVKPTSPPLAPPEPQPVRARPTERPDSHAVRARPAFDLGADARMTAFANGGPPLFGAGISSHLHPWPQAFRPSFEVAAFGTVPSQMAQPGVVSTLTTAGIRALLKLDIANSRGFGVDVGAGVGADILFLSVSDTIAGAQLHAPPTAVDPVFEAKLGGWAPLSRMVALSGAIGIDADLSPTRFVMDQQGAHLPLVAPLPVRAFVTLGVLLHLVGEGV